MKKVIVFLLTLAIALGGLGYAHAAVSGAQDDLVFYPTVEQGDPTILDGLTAELTITCGDHLRWNTAHTFGGETATEFVYDRKGTHPITYYGRNYLEIGLSGGVSSSTNGGFALVGSDYGQLVQEVLRDTPTGGSFTKELLLSDYADYYRPDYSLRYEGDSGYCNEGFSLHSWMLGDTYYEDYGAYHLLLSAFRFPVQPGNTVSVTAEKDDAGQFCGIDFYPKNSPELTVIGDVCADGIWFVPIFRDTEGNPLPYESPAGHGIYFIPWKQTDAIRYADGVESHMLTPDVKNAELRLPLEDSLSILHMEIASDEGLVRMLACDERSYTLTTLELEHGAVISSLELLPRSPGETPHSYFFADDGYLLVVIGDQIALVNPATHTLLLTAPDSREQSYGIRLYDTDTGCIRFDGKTLVLTNVSDYYDGCFWIAAWRQGELVYYGEYDCSLMRGNDDFYYQVLTAEGYPVSLK